MLYFIEGENECFFLGLSILVIVSNVFWVLYFRQYSKLNESSLPIFLDRDKSQL